MTDASFSTYTYCGAHQNVALRMADVAGKNTTVFQDVLIPGQSYLLPDQHAIVVAWQSTNLITKSEGIAS